jgi:hypothetical protein
MPAKFAKAEENLHLATEATVVATEVIVQDGEETKKFKVQGLKFKVCVGLIIQFHLT